MQRQVANLRTQLPEIFDLRGWGVYKCPDFYVREEHPTCYPQKLVDS